jgi:electron transfer flavoprotein beta subunit
MKVVVPVKRVPDTAGEKNIDPVDGTLDREGGDSILCPVNEFALEEAMKLKESMGADVTVLLVGPAAAQGVVRKALSFGLDHGVQVLDDCIAGSDAVGTALVIARAIEMLDWDLVIFGNQSTDGRTSLVPAAVAEYLGVDSLTYARYLEVDEDRITVHREHEDGWDVVEAPLPAVVSVVEAINEPRYPTLKSTLAARSRPLDVWSLSDLALTAEDLEPATRLLSWDSRPARSGGRVVVNDSGSGAAALADWMFSKGLIGDG